jgi:hypothetical protein
LGVGAVCVSFAPARCLEGEGLPPAPFRSRRGAVQIVSQQLARAGASDALLVLVRSLPPEHHAGASAAVISTLHRFHADIGLELPRDLAAAAGRLPTDSQS